MKIPKTLIIIGHTVKVILKEKVVLHGKQEAGVASFNDNKIFLATKADDGAVDVCNSNLKETLLHECFHFIDEAMHLKLTEHQILCLARGILALIKDNNLDFRK
jgi:hypothetical protein